MKRFSIAAYAGVSLVALLATPAFAQTAPPAADDSSLGSQEDIIVTARRRDESVQDVPQVVNVVTSEELQKVNIRQFADVQTLVPGLQLRTEANGIGTSAQLRGVQFDANTGSSSSVQFYLNDAPLAGNLILQTAYDIGQIEVQRGPQGTLRGEATPSGSIAVTTHKPDLYKFGGYVQATGNDIGTINVNGALGVPVISGILGVRLAGAIEETDANRVRTIQRTGDYRDPYSRTESGRATAVFTPADFLHFEGTYQRLVTASRTFTQYESFSLANPAAPASSQLISPGDLLSIQENPSTIHQIYNIYNGRAEARALGQRLIYQFQRSEFNLNSVTNQDSANFLAGRDFYQTTNTNSVTTTHEVRLQNEERVFSAFDYVVGAFDGKTLNQTTLTQETPVFLPAAFGGGLATVAVTPITVQGATTHEQSFYGNLTYHLGDSTELSGGLRHLKYTTPNGALIIAGNTIVTPGFNDEGTIYTASIKHNFSRNFMLYASTGTSRRPGPNVVGDFSVARSALENSFLFLPAETSTNYEVGLKSSLFDKRLRFNATAFHQTFKNFPYRAPIGTYYVNYGATVTGGVVTITPNVGTQNFVAPVPVEVNGGEIELSGNITRDWTFGLLASYALGRIKNGVVPCNDLNGDGIPDATTTQPTLAALQAVVGANNVSTCRVTQRSAFQSPFSATLQTEYHHGITPGIDAYGRGLFTFLGRNLNDPGYAYDDVGSYGLLNLFAGIRDPKGAWEVAFFAKNVANVNKTTSVGLPATTNYQRLNTSFVASAATATSTYAQINSTPPREFGLNVRFAFGAR